MASIRRVPAFLLFSFLSLLILKAYREQEFDDKKIIHLSRRVGADVAVEGFARNENATNGLTGRNLLSIMGRDFKGEVEKWKVAQEEREKEDASQVPKVDRGEGQPYTLGPKIDDWNEQRAAYIRRHPGSNIGRNGKDRILLVTGSQPKMCENDYGDHLLLKSLKNKLDYCNLKGIDIFYNLAQFDKEMSGFWSKLPLIRILLLSHPEVEWLWWMDSDAMFTDMSFELPIERYKNYNLVLHGWDDMVYFQKDWVGLNTGSFLMRNNQWMLDLLDEWAPMGPKGKVRDDAGKILTANLKGRPAFEADDQSALVWLLIQQRDRWRPQTFLESSFYLHGYWAILVDRYEEMMEKYHPGLGDDRWPFVTHFVGCKPCGKLGELDLNDFKKCVYNMERAYNFADNQLLRQFGYEHVELGSFAVRPSNITTKITLAAKKSAARSQKSESTDVKEGS